MEDDNHVRLIQSVQRALEIFNCFNEDTQYLSLGEISKKLNLNINTTRGIMNTLVYYDYISHDHGRNRYSLGPQFSIKAQHSVSPYEHVQSICEPYLQIIADRFKVSARLQFVSKNKIDTVKVIESNDTYYTLSTKGNHFCPLHASASGKLLLAFLDETNRNKVLQSLTLDRFTAKTMVDKTELFNEIDKVRENYFAIEDEEVNVGVSCIAAPLFKKGKIIGTISVVSASAIINEIRESCSKVLVQYAKEISERT